MLQIIFDSFGGPKAPQWGGLIKVAPKTHIRQRGLWKLKNQNDQNDFKPGLERRSCRPDHNDVNGSSIRAHMRENEHVKVLVKV